MAALKKIENCSISSKLAKCFCSFLHLFDFVDICVPSKVRLYRRILPQYFNVLLTFIAGFSTKKYLLALKEDFGYVCHVFLCRKIMFGAVKILKLFSLFLDSIHNIKESERDRVLLF